MISSDLLPHSQRLNGPCELEMGRVFWDLAILLRAVWIIAGIVITPEEAKREASAYLTCSHLRARCPCPGATLVSACSFVRPPLRLGRGKHSTLAGQRPGCTSYGSTHRHLCHVVCGVGVLGAAGLLRYRAPLIRASIFNSFSSMATTTIMGVSSAGPAQLAGLRRLQRTRHFAALQDHAAIPPQRYGGPWPLNPAFMVSHLAPPRAFQRISCW